MKGKLSWPIFWALVGVFVIIVSAFCIPALRDLFIGGLFIAISGSAFFLLGVALIVLTVREKVAGKLKKFLLLTGASATGIFVSFLLHNLIYGLLLYFFDIDFDEPFFFIMTIFVCPLGFLVGAVGTIVLAIKKKQTDTTGAVV